jgi:hypothetical protein
MGNKQKWERHVSAETPNVKLRTDLDARGRE